MSLRSFIYSELLTNVDSNVYPLVAPEKTTDPYAVYFISRQSVLTQDGVAVKAVVLRIEIYGNDWDAVEALAKSYESYLDHIDPVEGIDENLMVAILEREDEDYLHDEQKFNITQEYTLKFE
jgi:hypothetical protein